MVNKLNKIFLKLSSSSNVYRVHINKMMIKMPTLVVKL